MTALQRQRAWVTGASGFLGGAIARELAQQGYWVEGLGRQRLDQERQDSLGLSSYLAADVALPGVLDALSGPPDVVIHCAGAGTVGEAAAAPLTNLNASVAGTAHLCDWLRHNAPNARLVFVSSAAVYGCLPPPHRVEASPQPVSDYGWHKLMGEHLLSAARQKGLSCTAVRYFSLYGEGLRKQVLWDTGRRALADGKLVLDATGGELRDFLNVDDAARLAVKVATCETPPPVVNGGTGQGITLRDLITRWMALVAPGVSPEFTGKIRPGDPRDLVADAGGFEAIGFAPSITLDQGLAAMARWLIGQTG